MEHLWNEISKLNRADQLLLANQIWNNLKYNTVDSVSAKVKSELNRRDQLNERGEITYDTWENVRARVRAKHGLD